MDVSHFSDATNRTLKGAQNLAAEFGHPQIDNDHLMLHLLRDPNGMAGRFLRSAGLSPASWEGGLTEFMKTRPADKTRKGSVGASPMMFATIERATEYMRGEGDSLLEPEHLFLALVDPASGLVEHFKAVEQLPIDEAKGLLGEARSVQAIAGGAPSAEGGAVPAGAPMPVGEVSFTEDFTAMAKAGKFDPVVGRTAELRRILEVLSRRTKNNPVLVGEPGVGKTAVVELFAQKIVEGDVPKWFEDCKLLSLSMTQMVAGAKYQGEFEERFQKLLDDLIKMGDKVVLFIDEIHTICGGGKSAAGDAANILKPALARGKLKVLGATTHDEYVQNIEKDKALERRFERVEIKAPDFNSTIEILNGVKSLYEKHHEIVITEDAVTGAVRFSKRYIPSRQWPDSALDLLDEAGSSLKVGVSLELKGKPETEGGNGEKPQLLEEHIAAVIERKTGVPMSKMLGDEQQRLLKMEEHLVKRVVGQDDALRAVSEAVRKARAGLKRANQPMGSFFFLGPTGTGKTELVKGLADFLFDDEKNIVRIDMSEYMEKHSVAKLIGAPPGYVGFEAGGALTEAVRRHPYSVILFDEIEKAHPDVFNIMLQLMDEGRLTDSHSRTVDFTNCLVILTSNYSAMYIQSCDREDKPVDMETLDKELKKHFRPEFLARLTALIVFHSHRREAIDVIVDIQFGKIAQLLEERGIKAELSPEARKYLGDEGYDFEMGARPLQRVLDRKVLNPLSIALIEGKYGKGDTVLVGMEGEEVVIKKK